MIFQGTEEKVRISSFLLLSLHKFFPPKLVLKQKMADFLDARLLLRVYLSK